MDRLKSPKRLMGLLVALVVVLGAWSEAQARIHSLTGNIRFQIGNGLPLPITLMAPPQGKIAAIPGATIRQHGTHMATAPAKVVLDPFQLTYPGTAGQVIPVFGANPNVFQVFTKLSYMYPLEKVSLRASGRTGAAVVTFCGKPGSTVTANGNPGCPGGPGGTGLLRYTRTTNQFGGPAQGNVGYTGANGGNVALNAGGITVMQVPIQATVTFFNIQPNAIGAGGAPFGFANMTAPTTPSPGSFIGTILSMPAPGLVVGLMSPMGPGGTNAGTSWGGPLTTGMVTASNPTATPMEKFTLTGMDARSSGTGMGSLSLVSGGFSQRTFSGPNANRGWINLTIGAATSHVPAMPVYAVAILGAVTALTGAWALRRRNR